MPSRSKQILTQVAVIFISFAAGWCAGSLMYPELFGTQTAAHAEDEHADHADDHLDLSEQAVANLGLKMGGVELGEFWERDAFPGEVVEIPGQSDISVAAPVTGVVEYVAIRDGQTVEAGDLLFELRITDAALLQAQSELLSVLSQLDIANREINRLAPLTSEGLVGKNRKRELEYEVQKFEAKKQTKTQEILAFGLPATTFNRVLETRELATRISVTVPAYTNRSRPTENQLTRQVGLNGKPSFSVAEILAHPGRALRMGEQLCDLSYHGRLYIKGQAFESDVDAITKLCNSDWGVTAEFGHEHHDGHQHSLKRDGLQITRIDNHVGIDGLFSFYMPIENEVVQEVTSEDRLYQQWRFRPGQRVHLRIPVARFENKIKVPVEAVAIQGPNAFVFRKQSSGHDESADIGSLVGIGVLGAGEQEQLDHDDHAHDHAAHDDDHAHDDHDHDEHDHGHAHDDHDHAHGVHDHAFLQLEPVPVHVLHRGHDFVVLAPDGELVVGDEIAMNAAYKLQLAMQMAAGGDGGHGHEH